MSKPLRLGFIGGGLNSAVGRAHYAACRMDGKFEVVAGCFSRDLSVNEETAKAFNCRSMLSYYDVTALYHRGDIDAAAVLIPTPSHHDIVSHLLCHGVPVICEKAMASTSEESANLINARNKHNGFIAVTYNYTGYPMVREMRSMIARGDLGEIVSVQIEMPQEGYLRKYASPQEWRTHDGAIPAVHLDLGTHLHHMIYFLTGQSLPQRLVAMQQSRSEFGVVDDVNCLADYAGFQASIWFGKVALGNRNGLRVRVYGTEASAEWFQCNPEEIMVAKAHGEREIVDSSSIDDRSYAATCRRFKVGHPAGFIEAYANLYADIAEWLQAHKRGIGYDIYERLNLIPRMYSAEIAHDGLVMMEAMVKSAKEKQWITL